MKYKRSCIMTGGRGILGSCHANRWAAFVVIDVASRIRLHRKQTKCLNVECGFNPKKKDFRSIWDIHNIFLIKWRYMICVWRGNFGIMMTCHTLKWVAFVVVDTTSWMQLNCTDSSWAQVIFFVVNLVNFKIPRHTLLNVLVQENAIESQ